MSTWKEDVKICLDIRDKSTPKQWLLPSEKLPGPEQLTVLDVPAKSGALTPEEIVMTESDVSQLLEAYSSGKWTVRQVVEACLKKAVIINQLVSCPGSLQTYFSSSPGIRD